MYEYYKDERFKRLSGISHGQIYNLRKSNVYTKYTLQYQHTKPVSINEIGIREKPSPNGQGYLRVDSVHGGDLNNTKGVYYINLVDELTQWEVVVCVEGISERYLKDIWNNILSNFPFVIQQFHSDNGSEFINKIVSDLLNKLNIRQSKSRPRHSNDNGLVESKNGWIIRKHFGYAYVDSSKTPLINKYLHEYFNEFVNFHRPSAFPYRQDIGKGKIKIRYRREDYKTPYEKLKEIDPNGEKLKVGFGYDVLDRIALRMTDYEYVVKMKTEYQKLLEIVR
jgi:hypothetical protein